MCCAVLFFSTGLALRMTRLGLAAVGICCRPPPGLNRTHAEGRTAEHRVRGLWCFERLIQSRPQRPLGRTQNTKLCARPPCHGGHYELAAVRTPGPAWPMGSAVLGLIHIDTATLGVPDSIWPSARVRFSVRTHGLDCPWVRGLVCSARRGAMAKVTEACDLTRKLAHDDRAKDGPGLRFREPAARSRQFAAEAGLIAYALMAAAAAAVGTSPARSRNPVAAGRRLCHRRPRGGESRGRRLRVRRSGWGVARPLLAAPSFRLKIAWLPPTRHDCVRTRRRS